MDSDSNLFRRFLEFESESNFLRDLVRTRSLPGSQINGTSSSASRKLSNFAASQLRRPWTATSWIVSLDHRFAANTFFLHCCGLETLDANQVRCSHNIILAYVVLYICFRREFFAVGPSRIWSSWAPRFFQLNVPSERETSGFKVCRNNWNEVRQNKYCTDIHRIKSSIVRQKKLVTVCAYGLRCNASAFNQIFRSRLRFQS